MLGSLAETASALKGHDVLDPAFQAEVEDAVTLSISEVAARTGLRSSALRYYEAVGLIRSMGRSGGRRHFDPDVLTRLAFIALARDVGFTLDEIAMLVDGGPRPRQRWRHLAERKLDELQRKTEQLQGMIRLLEAALACGCDRVEGCELVEGAAERRRIHHNEIVRPTVGMPESSGTQKGGP